MPDPNDTSDVQQLPEAIKVPVIAGTGDGRLPAAMSGTVLPTPGTQNANAVLIVVPAIVALLVRAGNTFFTVFVSTITAAGASSHMGGPAILAGVDMKTAAYVALSAVVLDFAKNCITIFGRLEGKYPLITGSV